MKKYVFHTGLNTLKSCEIKTEQLAIDHANNLSEELGTKVSVYKEIHSATPDTGRASKIIEEALLASTDKTIEALTRDISKILDIPSHLFEIEVDLSEITGCKPEVWVNNEKMEESIVDSIIEEPSRTINNSKQTPAIPYEKIQHRADFLNNFKNGWDLYNINPLFRTITMLVMNGASIHDLLLELIFMVDGKMMPETSYLKPNKDQDNETK